MKMKVFNNHQESKSNYLEALDFVWTRNKLLRRHKFGFNKQLCVVAGPENYEFFAMSNEDAENNNFDVLAFG